MTAGEAAPGRDATGNSEPPFFAVSLLKLTVLSLCTFGIYEAFWLYWNWRIIKRREGTNISPFWRAFFIFFYVYPLFKKIDGQAEALRLRPSIPAVFLTVVWIVISFLWLLPDPYSLLSFLTFAPLLPVQALANRVNAVAAPDHDPNRRFTVWNWVAIVVGGALLILVIVTSFFPLPLPDADIDIDSLLGS
jgi:hypothetical protein